MDPFSVGHIPRLFVINSQGTRLEEVQFRRVHVDIELQFPSLPPVFLVFWFFFWFAFRIHRKFSPSGKNPC